METSGSDSENLPEVAVSKENIDDLLVQLVRLEFAPDYYIPAGQHQCIEEVNIENSRQEAILLPRTSLDVENEEENPSPPATTEPAISELVEDSDEVEVDEDNEPPEEAVVQAYIEKTLDPSFECCPSRCVHKFNHERLAHHIKAMANLKQFECRRLIQFALAYSLRHTDDEDNDVNSAKRKRHRQNKIQSNHGVEAKERLSYELKVLGHKLCRKAFMRINYVGERIVKSSQASISEGIILAPPHQRGTNLTGVERERTARTVEFLTLLAEEEGLPCPSGRGSKPGIPVIYLPPTYNKRMCGKQSTNR